MPNRTACRPGAGCQRSHVVRLSGIASLFLSFLLPLTVNLTGATYSVPSPSWPDLQAVADVLQPGDIVEVQGNATYPGGVILESNGTPENPIIIRGITVNGQRPRLHGGGDVIKLDGDNTVFENFEITGSPSSPVTNRGIFCVANNLVVRNCVVHDCPRHGILGADQYSGNTTLEYLEIYNCGSGTQYHQVYMATDNLRFPGAKVRIQYCYIHNGNGGNNIKSRAGRNEIYYNWVEGALYHELELIGADPDGQSNQTNPNTVREDSDVAGNVLRKVSTSSGALARIGGDGTGDSNGRFRFVNNTMIMSGAGSSALRIFDHVQSLEMFNNVIWRPDGSAMTVVRTVEQTGTTAYSGAGNWLNTGSTGIPSAWSGTITGTNPAFVNSALFDYTPTGVSPLRNLSVLPTTSPEGFPFPDPLSAPAFLPKKAFTVPGTDAPRILHGVVDIGAFEEAGISAIVEWPDYPE